MEFRFAAPVFLLLLLLPVLLYVSQGWRRRFIRRDGLLYSDTRLVTGTPANWRVRLARIPDVLRWLAWVLLVVALARPQMGNAQEVLRGQGIDIVLAFDISDSMGTSDFEPTRLDAAKAVMESFIDGRTFDRIGLVAFALNAYHQAPLTLDYATLLALLDEVRLASEIPEVDGGATAIGLGIASSANMLRESQAASRVIVLLTDGDNNASLDPMLAAEAAAAFDIRIYTIGMGRRGLVTVAQDDGTTITLESDLNETMLREIAATGGGLYFNAADLTDLQDVFAQIDRLERSNIELRVIVRWQDRVWTLLWVAFVLLVIERSLRRTVFEAIP